MSATMASSSTASTSAAGHQNGSSSAAYDPKQDPEIFRPDGVIVFPRSDGDPAYGPPNTEVPPRSAADVNYYHVFDRMDPKYQRWCLTIGQDLASWAGKGKKAPNGNSWRLKAFPADYQFTEQRKGPRHSYRTDPYLFGSNAHRFRSTKEFLHHAQWLICDPTLDPSKCMCKYCTHSRTAIPTPGTAPTRRTADERPVRQAGKPRASLPTKKVPTLNAVRIRTQQLPPPNKRVELGGVVVPSVPARDGDLSRAASAQKGQCEGFRVGEVVWVTLTNPVVDPQKATRMIDKWPAIVSEVTFTTHIAPPNAPTADPRRANGGPGPSSEASSSAQPAANANGFSLAGRVKQHRMHDIVLLGAPADRARVGEDRLRPFLVGFVDDDVKRSSFGKAEEHTWLDKEGGVPPKLFLLEPRPASVPAVSFSTVVAALAYSMTACSYMRCRYLASDPFDLPEGARVVPPPAPEVSKPTNGAPPATSAPASTAGPSSAPTSYPPNPYGPQSSAPVNGPVAAGTAAPAVTPSSVPNGAAGTSAPHANNEIRPGLGDRQHPLTDDNSSPSTPKRAAAPAQYKPGHFYQGIHAGLERLWVGDMVRLRLREREVKEMFESIALEKKLERKSDANDGFDTRGSYVMRVRAFMEENRKLRAAGRVYQVMTKAQFEAKRTKEKELYDAKAERDAAGGDPFGGMGKPFAFPAMGVLTAAGTELPATPQMPEDFYLSPINRDSHEVCMDLVNVAGRLWPSLGRDGDAEIVQEFADQRVAYSAALDCEEPVWARVSLAGGLPGYVKPMNLEARERGNRDELMKACFEIARVGVRGMIREAIQSEGGYVPPDPQPVAAAAAAAADSASAAGADQQAPSAGTGPEGSSPNDANTNKRKADGPPSAALGDNGSAAATPAKRPAIGSASVTASNSPSVATANALGKSSTATNGSTVGTPTSSATAPTSTPVTKATANGSAGSGAATASREGSPPLPAGWMKKVSRSGHGVYYANPRTKQTSWNRPTE